MTAPEPLGPGVYADVPLDRYIADPCPEPSLSESTARLLLDACPRAAWEAHPRLNPAWVPTYSSAFDLGTACHRHILEGDESFAVIEAPDYRRMAAQAARHEARERGQTPLLSHQMEQVRAIRTAVLAQAQAFTPPIPLQNGHPELTVIWMEGAAYCRARLDYHQPVANLIEDLKTTSESAHPALWSRRLFDRGGELQAAFHLRAAEVAFGRPHEFRYIAVETDPPHLMSVVALDPEALEYARARMRAALDLWTRCRALDRWPGYPARVAYAEVPPYITARWMELSYFQAALDVERESEARHDGVIPPSQT